VATTEDDTIEDKPMPLLDHLVELRRRIIYAAAAFLVCFVGAYQISGDIYYYLARPLAVVLKETGGADPHLVYTQLYEAFFTKIKVAMFGGAFVSFPIIATQIWMFVAPGLYRSEKRAFLPFLVASPVLFMLGAALAYFFVFPFAWEFFASFQDPTGGGGVPIELLPKVGEYLDLVMKLIFAFGLTFQIPVALTLLCKVGILNSGQLKKFRRYAYLGLTILSAIMAPPDALTMILLAVPLYGLYEISILAAQWVEPKRTED
jgi:sec-independent protein translocase protein TatC